MRVLHGTNSILSGKDEEACGIITCQNFSMSFCIALRELQRVDHKWVTSGLFSGSTGVIYFQSLHAYTVVRVQMNM